MQGICQQCSHYDTCKTPCAPVARYISQDGLAVYEKTAIGENGEEISIVFARSREIPESMLPQISGENDEAIDSPFTTEAGSPFAGFNPDLKQTGVFIDRFFGQWSFADLAVKYDVTAEAARKLYHAAVKRLLEIIQALDGKDSPRNFEPWERMVQERSGSFPLGVKWFLLNKLFALRPSEIAKLEGVKHPSGVRALIIRVSDQLRSGEISLFETDDPEKAEDSKARLDTLREKRRERHARNREKINASRRAKYIPKNDRKPKPT